MKLGCFQSNQGLHQLSFHDFIEQAAQLGYEAIDIPLNVPDAAAAVRQLGMQVNSVGALVLSELSTLETRLEGMAREVTAAIDSAAQQQVPTITTLVGRIPGLSADENIAIFRDLFTPLAAHAEARGVKFAFENWPRNGTMLSTTPELWDAMFTAVPSPALGLCYDPSHLYWQGIEYIQPIYDFADRIYHAHAKDTEIVAHARNRYGIYGRQLDATKEADWWRYRLPGYGAVDWHRYLDALIQVGYDAVLSVEHEDPVWSDTPELALRGLRLAHAYLAPMLA
jgi:sugar phosphate isomerase/epimerase